MYLQHPTCERSGFLYMRMQTLKWMWKVSVLRPDMCVPHTMNALGSDQLQLARSRNRCCWTRSGSQATSQSLDCPGLQHRAWNHALVI